MLQVYNNDGYYIMKIECGGEFKSLMEKVVGNLDMKMNYENSQDHVPQAKRKNRMFVKLIIISTLLISNSFASWKEKRNQKTS